MPRANAKLLTRQKSGEAAAPTIISRRTGPSLANEALSAAARSLARLIRWTAQLFPSRDDDHIVSRELPRHGLEHRWQEPYSLREWDEVTQDG